MAKFILLLREHRPQEQTMIFLREKKRGKSVHDSGMVKRKKKGGEEWFGFDCVWHNYSLSAHNIGGMDPTFLPNN